MRIGSDRFSLDAARASARERPYSVRRTWWCFLWQMLQGNATCRQVVIQLQAQRQLGGLRPVDDDASGYCQARARLPKPLLVAVLQASAQAADTRVTPPAALRGRIVKVLDATTLTLPDTPENWQAYPQPTSQKPGVGFPQLHLLVVWSGGGVLDHARGPTSAGELRLLHRLLPTLVPHDIVIYDRAAGNYVGGALLRQHQVVLISRVNKRLIDFRQRVRLGPHDRLVTWKRATKDPLI